SLQSPFYPNLDGASSTSYYESSCVTKSAHVRERALKRKSREASEPRPAADETAEPRQFQFLWEAPAGPGPGYAWAGDDLRRIPGAACRTYDLLAAPVALYRELARTPPTREGVLAFAQQYGALYADRGAQPSWLDDGTSSLGRWRHEIISKAECVKV